MLTAADYLRLSMQAMQDAREYRAEAAKSRPDRSDLLLKWAENRDSDAAFYKSRMLMCETEHHEAA
ncbi:hypothetical protein [Rhizobium leguminosarum]|uniref:hypothetical protein n=1 Tax=Rhizobium leguminosarum TaxID=384 RepID=UPI001C9709ED|nr:hypothetical protein [Rhizobium leguminosarum]MBY5821443.1 hypothetical protein [Rhizobium leguminosarum]